MRTKPKLIKKHFTAFDRNVLFLSLPILIWCIVRAFWVLEITHDEAYSFRLVYEPLLKQLPTTANNHWLNTFFLFLETKILGTKLWMLRIHSVVSIFFFSYFLWKIVRQWNSQWLAYMAILLLLYNTYILDFFSLARGYAMGLSFGMAALYYIFYHNTQTAKSRVTIYTLLSLASLAVYTHFYILLAYFLYEATIIYRLKMFSSLNSFWNYFRTIIPFVLFSIVVIINLKMIQNYGDLKEGYDGGFVKGCIQIFMEHSYDPFLNFDFKFLSLYNISFDTSILIFFINIRKNSLVTRLSGILFLVFLIEQVFHILFGTPFSEGRTSLFYNMHYLLLFPLVLDHKVKSRVAEKILAALFFIFYIFNIFYFIRIKNFHTSYEWWKSQGMQEVVLDIEKSRKKPVEDLSMLLYAYQNGVLSNYYSFAPQYPPVIENREVIHDNHQERDFEKLTKPPSDFDFVVYPTYSKVFNGTIAPGTFDTIAYYPNMKSFLLKKKE